MRFMLFVIPGKRAAYEGGAMPDVELIAAMSKFNEELSRSGALLAADGLHPSARGARIEFNQGKAIVTDGPFAESKELIGGYWLIEVESKEEALRWASRPPMEDGDVIELRQVFDMSDFSREAQEAARF